MILFKGRDEGVHRFFNGISSKVKVIARSGFELA